MFSIVVLSTINAYPLLNLLPNKNVGEPINLGESLDMIVCDVRANVMKAKPEEGLWGKIRTLEDW